MKVPTERLTAIVASSDTMALPYISVARSEFAALASELLELREASLALVNAAALSGVRELVAGWNGEGRPDGPYSERHPPRLGATLPKTDCGSVYALDEAMQRVRSLQSHTGEA